MKTSVIGILDGLRNGVVVGWAYDGSHPHIRVELAFLSDGNVIARSVANDFRGDLLARGIGDGRHGFSVSARSLAPKVTPGRDIIVQATGMSGSRILGTVCLDEVSSMDAGRPGTPGLQDLTGASGKSATETKDPRPSAEFHLTARNLNALMEASHDAEMSGNLQQAADLLDQILARDAQHFEALFRRARVALRLGKHAEARVFAGRGDEIRPNHPRICHTLALLAEVEGQRALALAYWGHVPERETFYVERLVRSARLLGALERPDEALACLREAVRLKPEDATARQALLKLLQDRWLTDEAIAEWEVAKAIWPGSSTADRKVASLRTIRLTDAGTTIKRYRHAMQHLDSPLALGIGGGIVDCLLAGKMVTVIAEHFASAIDLVVSELTVAAKHLFRGHPDIRQIHAASDATRHYELALCLPEFSLWSAAANPRATLRHDFSKTSTLTSGTIEARYQAYTEWLSDILAIPHISFAKARARIVAAPPGAESRQILLVRHANQSGWHGYDGLLARLSQAASDCALMVFPGDACDESEFMTGLNTLQAARLVVSDSIEVAGLAASMGIPLMFLATGQSEKAVSVLAPEAAIHKSPRIRCDSLSCMAAGSIWDCACLQDIGVQDVYDALAAGGYCQDPQHAEPIAPADEIIE